MAVVRPEQPGDVVAIHVLHAASFPTDAEARLVSLLRAAGHLPVSLVAEVDGAVVGHVAFSPVMGRDRRSRGWAGPGRGVGAPPATRHRRPSD